MATSHKPAITFDYYRDLVDRADTLRAKWKAAGRELIASAQGPLNSHDYVTARTRHTDLTRELKAIDAEVERAKKEFK